MSVTLGYDTVQVLTFFVGLVSPCLVQDIDQYSYQCWAAELLWLSVDILNTPTNQHVLCSEPWAGSCICWRLHPAAGGLLNLCRNCSCSCVTSCFIISHVTYLSVCWVLLWNISVWNFRRRFHNLRGSRNLDKITTGHLSRLQFHLLLLEVSRVDENAEACSRESGNV